MPTFDLANELRDIATRNPGRTEADVQAIVRDLLIYGGFDLGEDKVRLEQPAENRRRLDVAVGALIIECKRDLRGHQVLAQAEKQLGDYLAAKAAQGGRYVGILTDGTSWRLYRWGPGHPIGVSHVDLDPARINERRFRLWMGSILATEFSVQPTAELIASRLGADSPTFALARTTLQQTLDAARAFPGVAIKRQLWAKLLRSALGTQFEDTDELFVDHTYLVLLATLIGHAVVGFDLRAYRDQVGVLLSGQLFEKGGLVGVGQAGFFDWVLDTPDGPDIVSDIVRRVSAFEWTGVEHDILKALYQSVIAPQVRKRLGEYYTPDWLASSMVTQTIVDPLNQTVLDPACGSGTFLFHAIRHYLDAAEQAGMDVSEALDRVTSHVFGVDLHPVAVTLAQTTYLLAIGADRLVHRTQTLSIPVYLGDSMRWESLSDEGTYTTDGDIVLYTAEGLTLFDSELRFPAAVVKDAGRFDYLVKELVSRASSRAPGSSRPSIDGLLNVYGVTASDRPIVKATYGVLCDLHDQGRDHIWGFYIRNQSRPTWLSRPDNHVDVVIGNPPWLAYRFMPAPLQKLYERRARQRGLWHGGGRGRTTQQDLSAYFVVRAIESYLRPGGRFAFVMPRAVLSRQTYKGFRTGKYTGFSPEFTVEFSTPWDLGEVKPDPFPIPSCVVFGRASRQATPMPSIALTWSGRVPSHGYEGEPLPTGESAIIAVTGEEEGSPYRARFRAGAVLFPRMLIMVTDAPTPPLGVPQGQRAVRSRKTSLDKVPWRDLPPVEDVVESVFVRSAYLGESLAPFRILAPLEAVIPYDGNGLMDGSDDRIDRYPGLAKWWRRAEKIWLENRTSDKRTLIENLDYMHQLSAQFPIHPWRVVYTASGNTLAAAVVHDPWGVVEHSLYWARVESQDEARYLVAILNSSGLNEAVKPYQSMGAFGPRHFDKYIWMLPIPLFDVQNPVHARLVDLSQRAERLAHDVPLTPGQGFQRVRRAIRAVLQQSGLQRELDSTVSQLLA